MKKIQNIPLAELKFFWIEFHCFIQNLSYLSLVAEAI